MRTKVIFRKYKKDKDHPWIDGQIIAILPEDPSHVYQPFCTCFEYATSHGDCDYDYIVSVTKLATPEEYKDLKEYMETQYEYDLEVYSKRTPNMRKAFEAEQDRWKVFIEKNRANNE